MSDNKENIKVGKGHYISSQLKRVVINLNNKLSERPRLSRGDVLNEKMNVIGLSEPSIRKIFKNGQ
jgi:hypothetical protein